MTLWETATFWIGLVCFLTGFFAGVPFPFHCITNPYAKGNTRRHPMTKLTAALYHISALALLWMWLLQDAIGIKLSGLLVTAFVLIFFAIGFILNAIPTEEAHIENRSATDDQPGN